MKEITEILTTPSWAGVAALAILGLLYLARLALDFAKAVVLPKVYERQLQRRRLILPLAHQVLDANWKSPAFFRDGNPKATDFKHGYVFRRPELAQGMRPAKSP
jgi:hypothetical protein